MVDDFFNFRNEAVCSGKRLRNLRGALFTACLLAYGYLSAQPSAIASLRPERIETGDTTGLLILVSGLNAAPKDVDFSPWASTFPVSNIIGRSEWHRSGAQWIRRFTLIAFDSATLELPPVYVQVATGKPLETNTLTLTVFPTRAGREITDMATIRDIHREPASYWDFWPWAAGILIGIILLVWWLRNKQRKVLPVVVPNETMPLPVSATEMALQKLSELREKQLWKKGQLKEHYAELSLILRTFLESRYGIAALESTTSEIRKLLAGTDFSPEARIDLKELLQKADLVKYAQSVPEETVHEAVLINARALVAPDRTQTIAPARYKSPNPPINKRTQK